MYFCDSVQHYSQDSEIAQKWSEAYGATYSTTRGRSNDVSICLPNDVGIRSARIGKSIPDTHAHILVQFRYQLSGIASYDAPLLTLYDGTTIQSELWVTSTGNFALYTNGTLRETGTYTLAANVSCYVEVLTTIATSGGTYEVRVDSVSDISYTGVTQVSANAYATLLRFYGMYNFGSLSAAGYLSDIILITSSTSLSMLDECYVDAYYATGAGTNADWTPSTGSNYTCVNKTYPSADSKYISSEVNGDLDTYAYGDISSNPNVIPFVQVIALAKKEAGGVGLIKGVCLSSGTEADSSSMGLGTDYADACAAFPVDPHTSAAWTKTGFNAAEFGVMYSSS